MTTALVTGATSGIGRATADKLAQSGVHVIVVGRNAERGEKTVAEIRAAGGKADFISSDLRDAANAARLRVERLSWEAVKLTSSSITSGFFRLARRTR
jgi:short-subunit dehydrogenase